MLQRVTQPAWAEPFERFAQGGAVAGLDLTHAFDVAAYNSQAPSSAKLHDFGRAHALGVLVGNTRQLWPRFKAALAADPALRAEPHPLDHYVMAQLTRLAGAWERPFQLIFSHVTVPAAFPMQQLAQAVGFAALSPSHLSIHPLHGPWLALRAVLIVDVDGPTTPLPHLTRPCDGCSAPCVPALERALAATAEPLGSFSIAKHAAPWIAVRDACPIGKGSRYDTEQLRYHYEKARELL